MFKNILGILLLSGSLSFMGYFYLSSEKRSINPLQSFLEKEIENKKSKNELPTDWNLIKSVKYKYQSEKTNKLLGELPFIKTSAQGIYRLDITFMDEPESKSIILVQFNLINLKTSNLAYEFFLRVDLSQI